MKTRSLVHPMKTCSLVRPMKTRSLVLTAMFTALTAVGAWIRIPIPVCPFTLQLLFTMLAGILLGGRLGALSVLCYIGLGLAGLPVFADGGGIAYVFQPTFGYLIGFALGSLVTGEIAEHGKLPLMKRLLAADFAGLAVVYGCGMAYYWVIMTYYVGTGIGLWTLFLYCFLLAVPGDIVLCVLAAVIGTRVRPVVFR